MFQRIFPLRSIVKTGARVFRRRPLTEIQIDYGVRAEDANGIFEIDLLSPHNMVLCLDPPTAAELAVAILEQLPTPKRGAEIEHAAKIRQRIKDLLTKDEEEQ